MAIEISVVVPTFQRPELASRLIAALAAQSLPPSKFEVIIVDDHSGQETLAAITAAAVASHLDIRVLSTPQNGGPAVARNLGWKASTAPVIAFVDDDCLPAPGWLEGFAEAFQADPDLGVVQGRTDLPPGDDEIKRVRRVVWREVHGPTLFFEGCNIAYRRDALKTTGGFDEAIAWWGEDTALGWRVVEAGWHHEYCDDAVVAHDVEVRTFVWHVRQAWLDHHLVWLGSQHPGFRRQAFWRPWAYRRSDVKVAGAAVGLAASIWWRPAALAALPYVLTMRHDLRARGSRTGPSYVAERCVIDGAQLAGRVWGSIRHRALVV